MNTKPQARQHVRHPKLAMVSMLLGAFVGMFSETSLNIALPNLITSLHVNTATIQWLVTGYMLVIGIILPLSSLISKWFTTRQIIIFALADFIVGAVISALGATFMVVLIGRMNRVNPAPDVRRRHADLPATENWSGNGSLCTSDYVCSGDWANINRTDPC